MESKEKVPRFLIGAAASGSGKTLVTCGILQALKNRGMETASFKCGPDYIDPMFHSRVIGTKSRNLDTFFADTPTVRYLLAENGKACEISVIEGVMGYYDGVGGSTEQASAYDVAKKTGTPAVLVVNGKGMSLSVVPFIKGFLEYKQDSHICGVILNQISPMMYSRMKEMIETQLPIKVYGYLPVLKDCVLESRHLGLVLPEEITDLKEKLQTLAQTVEKTVDLDGLLELAKKAEALETVPPFAVCPVKQPMRIAVARDEAFCFLYEDNLELLKKMGAVLVEFSPLRDEMLPKGIQGLLLPGGYPELYAEILSKNQNMREAIREAIQHGLPYLAECGGFLYLLEELEDMEGNSWPMAGVIPGKGWRTKRLSRFGYITLKEGKCFGKETGPIPAHEFHYFEAEHCGESFLAQKPESKRNWRCIHQDIGGSCGLAGFPHLYFYGNPKVAEAFLQACEERK